MKASIEENIQITNCLFDKIKEIDENVNKMSLVENFKTNKAKIFAVIGNMLAMIFEEFGDYVLLIMPGTPVGEFIKRLASIILFGTYAITMYVFGNKHELGLKKDIIAENDMQIHALTTNALLKDYLLKENDITAPKMEDPNK